MPKLPAARARSPSADSSEPVASAIATSALPPYLRQRQRQPEGRIRRRRARRELEIALHPQRQLAPDREPEAEATLAGAPAAAPEPLEDGFALFLGDARTGVVDLDRDAAHVFGDGDRDRRVGRRDPQRVV